MRLTWGIKTQVLLITFIPIIAVSIFLGSYFTRNLLHNMQDSLRKNGIATALELAFSAEQGVFYGYPDILQIATDKAVNHEDISAAAIFDKNYNTLAHTGKTLTLPSVEELHSLKEPFLTINTDNSVRFIAPITLQDVIINDREDTTLINSTARTQTIGWVCVEVERSTITEKKLSVLRASFFIVLMGLLISALFALRLGRNVTEPILGLAKTLDKIRNGILDTRVIVDTHGELKILQTGVNAMAQALEENHEKMQKNIAKATQELRDTLKTIEEKNAELITAKKEALVASQVKSDVLANMSHEIRTPMNGILGFISLLLESNVDSVQKEYLEIVHQSAESLLKILNDILDLSKFEAGKVDLENISFDIRNPIIEAIRILSINAHEKKLQLIPHIYSDIPAKLRGDPFRIKQVVTNLVANAIKFTDSGSITVRCMLEEETDDEVLVKITITDTGPGLSKEEQTKLFQAFTQTDASITRRHGGTGLGLVICKKIVSQMGGDIGIESELGNGATFWFTVTLKKNLSDDEQTEWPLTAPQKKIANIPHFDKSVKVLIVDDNYANQRLVSTLLTEIGITTVTASDGYEALKIASMQSFSLILMDIQMPGLDGVATTQLIKQNSPINKNTPIIALTALSTLNERDHFFKNGMSDCLTKPIVAPQLHLILENWLLPKNDMPSETLIDWSLSLKLANDNEELAKEMLSMLIATLPEEKSLIMDAVSKNDIATLKMVVHRLHGGCCYCGVPRLKTVVKNFETLLKTTNIINQQIYSELLTILDLMLESAPNLVS